jgi:copper transport protein
VHDLAALLKPSLWALGADAPHRGRSALIVAGLALALLAQRQKSLGRLIAVAGALIACAGLPLSGHVAALIPPLPGQITLFFHTACAAFWVGALPLLALALRQSPPAEAHRLLRRFSNFAIAIVALLILAGIGVTLTRVHDLAALTETDYGRILLAKVGLMVLMLALAILNRRLTRALPGANGAIAARLKSNIILEIVAAAAILVLTAWLGHTRPPDEMVHPHAAAAGRAFMSVESDGASLIVEIDPGGRGVNRLTGTMTAPDGQPLAARDVAVELSLLAAGIEPLSARAVLGAGGSFNVDSVALPVRGAWTLRVDALIGDFEKRVFTLQLDID